MRSSFLQFIKFGIVGITNNIVFFIVYYLVIALLNNSTIKYDYIIGNIVGFFISVFWSYIINNKFVFALAEGEKRSFGKSLLKTYISYGFTGIVLNNVLSYIWISVLNMSKYISPLINLFITIPLNFVMNKYWAFKAKGASDER